MYPVETFLPKLATERQVSLSTHKQALSALLFLYREVLQQDDQDESIQEVMPSSSRW
jgi:hypothetical protein